MRVLSPPLAGPWADALGDWLCRSFPTNPAALSTESLHVSILQRLVNYCYFSLSQVERQGHLPSLQDDISFAVRAPAAIARLRTLSFANEAATTMEKEESRALKSRKRPSQAERKKQRQESLKKNKEAAADGDTDFLHGLGIVDTPDSPEDAQELAMRLLLNIKDLLVVSRFGTRRMHTSTLR